MDKLYNDKKGQMDQMANNDIQTLDKYKRVNDLKRYANLVRHMNTHCVY